MPSRTATDDRAFGAGSARASLGSQYRVAMAGGTRSDKTPGNGLAGLGQLVAGMSGLTLGETEERLQSLPEADLGPVQC